MPIFKAGDKLVLYAHVPKCGGSSVSQYLKGRFKTIAFNDKSYMKQEARLRWSQTSPQHIDRASLERLFPLEFFDVIFTVVRHPVSRLISAYHFQREVEKTVPAQTSFSDWLDDIQERRAEDPFCHDNHIRPMTEIVPEAAHVFYMEHGLDALVPWFDALTGTRDTPRLIHKTNERGKHATSAGERAKPTDEDLKLIWTYYREDFERFGYRLDQKTPDRPAPVLSPESIADREAALRRLASPSRRLRRLCRKVGVRV